MNSMVSVSPSMDIAKLQGYTWQSPGRSSIILQIVQTSCPFLKLDDVVPLSLRCKRQHLFYDTVKKNGLQTKPYSVSEKSLWRNRVVSSYVKNGGSNHLSPASDEGSKSSQNFKKTPEMLLPEAKSMEEVYDALAKRLIVAAEAATGDQKYFVALAGPPGSGKSTVAREVVRRVNSVWQNLSDSNSEEVAVAVPMDGFHLYRWQLDCFQDPVEAHARRGAPWTFNPSALVRHLARIRAKGHGYLPSFNHGVGDPLERDIFVKPENRLVLVEGNYLLLDNDAWKDLRPLFDESWFIDVDIDEAMERVERRHVATGKKPEVAKWRIGYNDRPNAELVVLTRNKADVIIPSRPQTEVVT